MAYVPITGGALAILESKPYAGAVAPQEGFFIGQLDNVWMIDERDENTLAEFAAWLEAFDDVAHAKVRAKERVAEELQRRMNDAEVQGFLLNQVIRLLRLQVKNSGVAFNSWPSADRSKASAANSRIQNVEGIGDAAEQINAEIDALTDTYAISGYDIANSPLWPTV